MRLPGIDAGTSDCKEAGFTEVGRLDQPAYDEDEY
jgi:hypothetical protein